MMHLQTHSNEFKFKCNFDGCDFAATTVHKLKFHKSTTHNPDKKFRCSECSKEFITKARLQAHLDVVHAPENKLKVRSCKT
jgi:KRAB domain-containing zinc finger protein